MDMNAPITKQDIADIVGTKVDQRFDELKSMIEKQGDYMRHGFETLIRHNEVIDEQLEKQGEYMRHGFETLIRHNEVVDEQLEKLSLQIDGIGKRNDHLAEMKADRTELTELADAIPEKVEQSVTKMIEINPEMFSRKRAA